MDLTISTKAYKFTFDGIFMNAIDDFMLRQLNTVGTVGKNVSITRKEVKQLLDYIQKHIELFNNITVYQESLYDKIYSMWLIMKPQEKMRLYWW